MTDIDVSVVVVNYNAGPMLAACLRAVARNRARCERIVVDNASTDHSLDGLDGLLERPLIRHRDNLGFATAVNAGLAVARGEAVLVLNPDCIVLPGAVDRLLDTLAGSSGSGLVGGLVVNLDGSEQRGCRRREPTPARVVRRMLPSWLRGKDNGIDLTHQARPSAATPVDAVSGAFLLARRADLQAIGGFDADYFLHFEDLDLCRRLRDRGRAVLFEPRALAVHLKSASGATDAGVVREHKDDGLVRYLGKFHRRGLPPGSLPLVAALAGLQGRLARLVGALRGRRQPASPAADPRQVLDDLDRWLQAPPADWLVVTGASSQVGDFLLPLADRPLLAVTRGQRAGQLQGRTWWVRPELPGMLAAAGIQGIGGWLQLAPIWVLDDFADAVRGLRPRRLVALGSTSVRIKQHSRSAKERAQVARLAEGEARVRALAARAGAEWTVLRPSMIYGNRNNTNVAFMARLVRLGVFPLVGEGRGRRQPVHALDVAESCLAVLDRPATFGRLYDLAGSEVIEFKEMIERIFAAESRRPAFVKLPAGVLRGMLALAGRLPGLGFLTPAMVDRLEQDLVFDIAPAHNDFDFSPRGFRP